MTTNLSLISTIYSPSRIILLTEEKARAEKMITDTLGSVIKVEKKYASLYDVVKVAKDVAATIEEESAKGQSDNMICLVIYDITDDRQRTRLGHHAPDLRSCSDPVQF